MSKWEHYKWYSFLKLQEAYDDQIVGAGFLIYAPSLIHADFNPDGIAEASIAVDAPEGLTIVAARWNNEQDCYDTVEVKDVAWFMLKPMMPTFKG